MDRTDDEQFLLSFDLRIDKIPTVVAALAAFESVVEAAEMDPE